MFSISINIMREFPILCKCVLLNTFNKIYIYIFANNIDHKWFLYVPEIKWRKYGKNKKQNGGTKRMMEGKREKKWKIKQKINVPFVFISMDWELLWMGNNTIFLCFVPFKCTAQWESKKKKHSTTTKRKFFFWRKDEK